MCLRWWYLYDNMLNFKINNKLNCFGQSCVYKHCMRCEENRKYNTLTRLWTLYVLTIKIIFFIRSRESSQLILSKWQYMDSDREQSVLIDYFFCVFVEVDNGAELVDNICSKVNRPPKSRRYQKNQRNKHLAFSLFLCLSSETCLKTTLGVYMSTEYGPAQLCKFLFSYTSKKYTSILSWKCHHQRSNLRNNKHLWRIFFFLLFSSIIL